jgi:hypothetical protein
VLAGERDALLAAARGRDHAHVAVGFEQPG